MKHATTTTATTTTTSTTEVGLAAAAAAAAADDDGDDDNNKETFKFYCTFPAASRESWGNISSEAEAAAVAPSASVSAPVVAFFLADLLLL